MTINYHRPLKMPADRQALIRAAIEADEDCVSVGGFAAKMGQLRVPQNPEANAVAAQDCPPSPNGLAAIARLVQLARREAGLTPDKFAKKVGLTDAELQVAEAGTATPEPRVLYALSEGLNVSYQKLLSLAGHRKQRDDALEREVLRFAAFSAPMDRLSKVEAQALHDLLRLLHD